MRVLVCNLGDAASTNIRDRLLETDDWQEAGKFRGHLLFQRAYDIMVQVDGPTVFDEDLSQDLAETDWPIHAVWFLSKHVAASGQPSLAVHPIGNHGAAKFGGKSATYTPAAARDMSALLRRLRHHATERELPHQVTFEGTHHGPLMQQPSLFVEIGSEESWYSDKPSGEVLAAAITDVLDGDGISNSPILVGIGGGHYVPRATDKAIAGEADFGHLVPSYGLDPDDVEASTAVLNRAYDASPGAVGVYMHTKGLKGPQRDIVRNWSAATNVPML